MGSNHVICVDRGELKRPKNSLRDDIYHGLNSNDGNSIQLFTLKNNKRQAM